MMVEPGGSAEDASAARRGLRIVILGHVDHGKSTLIGRILNDTASLPDGKLAAVEEMSRRRGMPFEWSFVLDALQAERDQGITIDTTQVGFRTAKRGYVVIDAPGHTEFLRNMVTGAAGAEAAVLLIDVREGTLDQSRRHAYLLTLLGVRQVAVAINKLDLVDFDPAAFTRARLEIEAYLREIGITASAFVPVSARHGDNVASRSARMPWYDGPTVLDALDAFVPPVPEPDLPLRLPVQDVYKPDERRIIAGRIESGKVRVGDTLHFLPGHRSAKVASIETWSGSPGPTEAGAGQSIGITLDQRIFVERGDIATLEASAPAEAHALLLRLFWFDDTPLEPGRGYTLKIATAEYRVVVDAVERVVDIETLETRAADAVKRNEIADVLVRGRGPMPVDRAALLPRTGRGVLIDGFDVVGGALVIDSRTSLPPERTGDRNLTAPPAGVTPADRARANGHRGGILWLTGLSGAGKSTLAHGLEAELFRRGMQVAVLDGDRLRQGLNADLGFSPAERSENIRRTAAVATLFADAGIIVIVSLISPTLADRAHARAIGGPYFREVYVKADLATCEKRDPKGLYARARRGEIPQFTGVGASYEPPEAPDLVVDTAALEPDIAVQVLREFVQGCF
jgi:bifunctional enzyme CysN/CysC